MYNIKFSAAVNANVSLKKAAKFLGALISAMVNADRNSDGRTTFVEIIFALGKLAWEYADIALELRNLRIEWNAATEEEKRALVSDFASAFQLPNAQIESLIEAIIGDITSLSYNVAKLIKEVRNRA